MSLEIQKPTIEVFSIRPNVRFAPAYDETLMPVPPRKRDCIGDECPVAQVEGSCFVDTHHLLFTALDFEDLGGVHEDLMNDPMMQVQMARCRHNSAYPRAMHSLYDRTLPPMKDASHAFLDESRSLRRLGLTIRGIQEQVNVYVHGSPKARYRAEDPAVIDGKRREIEKQRAIFEHCTDRVKSIEVIPATIVGRRINEVWECRRALAKVVDHCPAKIQELIAV